MDSWRRCELSRSFWEVWAWKSEQASGVMPLLRCSQDNVNTYRALAAAYWKSEDFLSAGKTYARALNTEFHPRYGDVKRIIREEAALLLRSIQDSSPKVFQDLTTNELKSVSPSEGESITLWISMSWLTDAGEWFRTAVIFHQIWYRGINCFFLPGSLVFFTCSHVSKIAVLNVPPLAMR